MSDQKDLRSTIDIPTAIAKINHCVNELMSMQKDIDIFETLEGTLQDGQKKTLI